jgi:site-specific recombinase XerD
MRRRSGCSEYLTDPRYQWVQVCRERFGQVPGQVFHEANSVAHVAEYEGRPGRRPLTYDEVQALFDAADELAEAARSRPVKGAVAALRNSALLKVIYAFGLRRREAWGLDVADFRFSPKMSRYGQFGSVVVRYGKGSRGSPPKRRVVLTVPEMDWVVPVLEHWTGEVRPRLAPRGHPAVWLTERRGRMAMWRINEVLRAARDAAGLPAELDLHCLRHSMITHLIEFGYPERFVQEQAGHRYASTTAIYVGVSDDYRSRLLHRALAGRLPGAFGEEPAP